MSKPLRPEPSLGVRRSNVPGVLTRAAIMEPAIVLAIALFPSLPIPMATFLLLLQAATAAQTATPLRTLGLSSLRDTKVDALWSAMLAIKTYVGGLASALDATSATALIQAAGLLVANPKTHAKDLLSATYVPATGVVQVSVNGMLLLGKKRIPKTTTFTYSWSADGGKKDGRACGLRALGSAGRGVAPGQRWRPRVGPLLRALPPHHEEPRPGLASGP